MIEEQLVKRSTLSGRGLLLLILLYGLPEPFLRNIKVRLRSFVLWRKVIGEAEKLIE